MDETGSKHIVKVPLRMLAECEGIIAKEVTTPEGAVILPSGIEIGLFEASLDLLISKMESVGITHVYLYLPSYIAEQDIDEIIERVYVDGDSLISREKTKTVIKKVDSLFRNIKEEEITSEVVTSLAGMGEDLTKDLLRNPSVAFSLCKVQDADEYTFVHSFNVAILGGFLANRLYPGRKEFIDKIVIGGLLHDMGKAKIPSEILNKPGKLTSQEMQVMQRHPALGVALALQSGISDPDIVSVIGGHHEKWSGKGYPKGLRGTEIPEVARVAAVTDVFDALTAKRVYKNPMSSRNAISIILKDAGLHFDLKVARELLVSLGLYPPGSVVRLSDERIGIVVSGGGKDLVRPLVLIQNLVRKAGSAPEFVDLRQSQDIRITEYLGHSEKRDVGLELGKKA